MTTTPVAKKQRKLTDRARKREEAVRRKRLAAAAKAASEEKKAEHAAPSAQRTAVVDAEGTMLRGVRLEFDGRTHTVHRANSIRTLADRGRNKDHALFKKQHADAVDKLQASWDLCMGGISSGVSQYEQRSASTPETGMISDGKLRTIHDQIQARNEIEAFKTYFGDAWEVLYTTCILGIPISTWAEKVKMDEKSAAGYLRSLLDRLVSLLNPAKDARGKIRTFEFETTIDIKK